VAARFDFLPLAINRHEFERAGKRIGLCQLELELVAHGIAGAAAFADQHLRRLLIAKVLAAQRGDRHQPVAPQPGDRGEEAEGLHTGDAGVEDFA